MCSKVARRQSIKCSTYNLANHTHASTLIVLINCTAWTIYNQLVFNLFFFSFFHLKTIIKSFSVPFCQCFLHTRNHDNIVAFLMLFLYLLKYPPPFGGDDEVEGRIIYYCCFCFFAFFFFFCKKGFIFSAVNQA